MTRALVPYLLSRCGAAASQIDPCDVVHLMRRLFMFPVGSVDHAFKFAISGRIPAAAKDPRNR
jgi:hypothetical protein